MVDDHISRLISLVDQGSIEGKKYTTKKTTNNFKFKLLIIIKQKIIQRDDQLSLGWLLLVDRWNNHQRIWWRIDLDHSSQLIKFK